MADGIFDMLLLRGVQVVAPGVFQPCVQPLDQAPVPELLRPSAANPHVLSRLLRVVADARSQELQGGEPRDRTRLLSAGGPTSGKSLVAPAGLQATHFNDEHFTGICRNAAASTGAY